MHKQSPSSQTSKTPKQLFDDGVTSINQGQYEQAYDQLRQSAKKYTTALLKMAEMHIKPKINFSAKRPSEAVQVNEALDLCEKALARNKKNQEFHKDLAAILKMIEAKEDLSQQLEARLLLVKALNHDPELVKTVSDQGDYIKYLIESVSLGNEAAKLLIEGYIKKKLSSQRVSPRILQTVYTNAIALLDEVFIEKQHLALILLRLVYEKAKTADDLSSASGIGAFFNDQSHTATKKYNRDKLAEQLDNVAKGLLEQGHQPSMINCLDWFLRRLRYHEDLANRISSTIQTVEMNDDTKFELLFKLGDYYILGKQPEHAQAVWEFAFQSPKALNANTSSYQQKLKQLYIDSDNQKKLQEFAARLARIGDGSTYYNEAKQIASNQNPTTIAEVETLKTKIEKLKLAALRKHKPAMQELCQFAEQDIPEAIRAKAEVLAQVGKHKARTKVTDGFEYPTKAFPNQLYYKARNSYERALKQKRPGIYYDTARMRYQGDLFDKDDFLARELFDNAFGADDIRAIAELANMCFHGEGGMIDLDKAKQLLQTMPQTNLTPNAAYLLAELYYKDYLYAREHQQTDMDELANQAIIYFQIAASRAHRQAILSLLIMSRYDQIAAATDCLEQLERTTSFVEETLRAFTITNPMQIETNIKDEFLQAENALAKDNPIEMRKFAERYFSNETMRDDAIADLVGYYRTKEHGIYNLMSSLCYEALRHKFKSPVCQVLHRVIVGINERYKDHTIEDYNKELHQYEETTGDYYDEYQSDQEDAVQEHSYQGSDHHLTADKVRPDDLVKKIKPSTLQRIQYLLDRVNLDGDYARLVDEIKSQFTDAIEFNPGRPTADKTVAHDLQTVNFYAALGDLATAMKLITTKFCFVETRGLHYKMDLWNQPMRRKFRRMIHDANHPLQNKPLYAAAVYKLAGVSNYTDFSELTQLRLQKAARYLHAQMMRLNRLPPHTEAELPHELQKRMTKRSYDSRRHQVQELYSNYYDAFHDIYLPWEAAQAGHIFSSGANPNVSHGEPPSSHSPRYAFGQKPYASHRDKRLRPLHDKNLRAHRPHSGAVMLTIRPLADLVRQDTTYVVAENMQGKVVIDKMIIPERESSTFAYVPADRVKFVLSAEYPSFDHQYLNVMYYKYGLDKELFESFKELFKQSKPHTAKRRLAVLLLGEFLCAYQTLYMMRYAHEKTSRNNLVLLYRDHNGMFSLKPTYEISPAVKGDSDDNRKRRYHTAKLRAQAIKGAGGSAHAFLASANSGTTPSSLATPSEAVDDDELMSDVDSSRDGHQSQFTASSQSESKHSSHSSGQSELDTSDSADEDQGEPELKRPRPNPPGTSFSL